MSSYYELNKERIRKYNKEYYRKNRDKYLERMKELNRIYYQENKEKILLKAKLRNAIKRNNGRNDTIKFEHKGQKYIVKL